MIARMKTVLVLLGCGVFLAACGGDGNSAAPVASGHEAFVNRIDLVVDGGPVVAGAGTSPGNVAYVSVKVCAPGRASQCVVVDHIQVDTGSAGLRLFASALPATLGLASVVDEQGAPVSECAQFASGYLWGTISRADVSLGDEVAANVAVQVIDDSPTFSPASVPASCSNSGPGLNGVTSLGAKGVLGVGPWPVDCGRDCAGVAHPGWYYVCDTPGCSSVSMPLAQQVPNIVTLFPQDNNGTVIQLPLPAPDGAVALVGSLTFGIGTRDNNSLGSAVVQTLDPDTGTLLTTYNGIAGVGFLDSGTNISNYPGLGLPRCLTNTSLYCPDVATTLTAVNTGLNGAVVTVSFVVDNLDRVIESGVDVNAYAAAGGEDATTFGTHVFDWGLPFFMGRSVFTAIGASRAAGIAGPWVAY